MSFKEYLNNLAKDLYYAAVKPVETARRLKASADLSYGLKVLLVSSSFFLFSMVFLSFVGDNIVYIYSIFERLNRFELNRAVSDYVGIILMSLWHLVVGFFIALPVFIVTSFLWMGVYWYIGKRRGGKAPYGKFFAAMMPVQMVLLLTGGLATSVLSELAEIICAVANVSLYKKDVITFILGLVAMPPILLANIYLQSIHIKEIHEISKRDSVITASLPAALALALGVCAVIAMIIFATYLKGMLPFYDY